tara:strand:- start:47 stop:391 length:345 start_codon:yes stop_codon:yes gene_type:complete
MDGQTKKLLIVVGIAVLVLWFTKPKNNMVDSMRKGGSKKLDAPKTLDSKLAQEQHEGTVGIQAMRSAIANGETKKELDKLNRMLLNENGVKVYVMSNGKLCARNRKGKTVAKEK